MPKKNNSNKKLFIDDDCSDVATTSNDRKYFYPKFLNTAY